MKGKPVRGICLFCKRQPRPGETYGTHAEGWDYTNICPECWDAETAEDDELPEDAMRTCREPLFDGGPRCTRDRGHDGTHEYVVPAPGDLSRLILEPVPAKARCVACGRGPREGEVYGIFRVRWAQVSEVCAECSAGSEKDVH